MNIGAGNTYPSCALSNFAPHPFEIDGVKCASMEGFLQSLKFANPDMQAHVCTLVGLQAKYKGKKKRWQTEQVLFWKGFPIARESKQYDDLITKAYDCMFENDGFRRALAAAGTATFTHTIGRSNKRETVLTEREFCRQLDRLRSKL